MTTIVDSLSPKGSLKYHTLADKSDDENRSDFLKSPPVARGISIPDAVQPPLSNAAACSRYSIYFDKAFSHP